MSKSLEILNSKILDKEKLLVKLTDWKKENKKIVFTNGCFDLIHLGHIEVIARSADLGDILIIGVNTDSSIKRLKGKNRPIVEEISRSKQLAALEFVDAVVFFDQDTPINLIKMINPNVITKGGDYNTDQVIGKDIVTQNNGEIVIIPLTQGYSTTSILEKIKDE
tara:strand:- start:169 stop:663 length:495 start_codon:yes stop_codon:yes gene_type:complete